MEDIEKVRQFIKDKSMALMSHEKKNYAQAGISYQGLKYLTCQPPWKSKLLYLAELGLTESIC